MLMSLLLLSAVVSSLLQSSSSWFCTALVKLMLSLFVPVAGGWCC